MSTTMFTICVIDKENDNMALTKTPIKEKFEVRNSVRFPRIRETLVFNDKKYRVTDIEYDLSSKTKTASFLSHDATRVYVEEK